MTECLICYGGAGRGGYGKAEIQGGVQWQVGYQFAREGEIQAGPFSLLSVILPSSERALKGAGPEGIFFLNKHFCPSRFISYRNFLSPLVVHNET